MKTGLLLKRISTVAATLCTLMMSAVAKGEDCGDERYFPPEEAKVQGALIQPHTEFTRMRRAARKGNAIEQRNLAVSYESGYLVSRCFTKAAEWYGRAAKAGDELAQKWIERNGALIKLTSARECYGSRCNTGEDGLPQAMSLVSDPRGHFFADLTINGVTVRGMIDTGATSLALGASTAARMGISQSGGAVGAAATANGTTTTVSKNIPMVKVGVFTLDNVDVSIVPNLDQPLIGMSVLGRLRLSAGGGQMTLSQ